MCGTIRLVVKGEQPTYIGPDLTAPANLYELMRFADAVFWAMTIYFEDGPIGCKVFAWPGSASTEILTKGPDRTTAVLAACAKALNIEEFTNANL